MFRRVIMERLIEWKNKENNKPLILRGARQVGKSTLAEELGSHYKVFIRLNLERRRDAVLFEDTDDIQFLIDKIALSQNKEYIPKKTLLFIDEIQELPKCIALLRYFYEDLPDLDVIAAGSLLEFAIGDVPSFPVGRVEQLSVYPMSFAEWLEALREDQALKYFQQTPTPSFAHDRLLELFNTYMIVGGMPEVVSTYVSSGKMISSLQPIYSSIWDTYVRDIEKYGSNNSERAILRHIIAVAPSVRDRITFAGFGKSNYRSREVGEAFRKLDKAGILRLIYPTSSTQLPIQLNYRRKPRVQFLDIGLMNYVAGIQGEMIGVTDLNSLYKGYLTQHAITQELICTQPRIDYLPPFWTRESANANAEVDLLITHKSMVYPVEVKSGAKGRLRSLHEFIKVSDQKVGLRLLANEYSVVSGITADKVEYQLINIPYYDGSKLSGYIEL